MKDEQEFNKFNHAVKIVFLTVTFIAVSGFFIWKLTPAAVEAQEIKTNNMGFVAKVVSC